MASPKDQKFHWCVQFQNPQMLEDRYVSLLLSDEELRHENPSFVKQREEYLRNRFRSYMNRFQLYTSEKEKLSLFIEAKANKIYIHDEKNRLH